MPTGAAQDTIVCPYNDVDAVAAAVAQWGEGLAAIVVEPVAGNMGVVPPAPGFLEALRALCDASGRAARLRRGDHRLPRRARRCAGALRRAPDLTILGKIVGGGLPLAAFGGRADVMDRLAPAGDVYQAGTLSGNPLATAAGLSVLRRLRDPAVYERLEAASARLEAGLAPFGRVQRVGAMLTLFMGDGPVTRFEDAQACDTERYGELFRAPARARRVRGAVAVRGWFVSTAHGDDEIDRTVEAVGDVSVDLWDAIADEAAAESPLWGEALRADPEREPVFSPLLADERYAVGLETIYEGYLLHYGRPRLFAPADRDTSLLLGDYLYAHGLVRVAEHDEVEAVADLAELISLCARLQADGAPGDGEAWAATAVLARARVRSPRAGFARGPGRVERALALHSARVG